MTVSLEVTLPPQHARVLLECSQKLMQVPQKLPPHFFTSLQRTSVQVTKLSSVFELLRLFCRCSWHSPHLSLLLDRQCRLLCTLTSLSRLRELSSTLERAVSVHPPLNTTLPPPLPAHRTPSAVCVRVKTTLEKSLSLEHKVRSHFKVKHPPLYPDPGRRAAQPAEGGACC